MTPTAGQRGRLFDGQLLGPVALAFIAVAVVLIVLNLAVIRDQSFPDPDDTLRMVQVRDLLAGQGWFDLHQHRVDALHGGVPMHWSRLVDIPLAGMILLLGPLLGQAGAESVTTVVVPLVTMGLALFFAGRIAWRLIGGGAVVAFSCLAVAMSVPAMQQLRPLRIDHHGWQIVLALVAANGLAARSPRTGGWVIGLALAAWLSISIEGLPMAALFMAVLALRWLRDPDERGWLLHAMLALAAGSVACFLATRGAADLINHCDAISPVHVAMFVWGALGISALYALGRRSLAIELAGFAAIAGGAFAILMLAAPQCARGSIVELDPLVRSFWYANVAEGLPVWRQAPAMILQMLVPTAVALAATVRLARHSGGWRREYWIDYAILLGGAIAVSVLVARAGDVAGALAGVPLGWQLREWSGLLRALDRPGKRALAMAAMVLALQPAAPVALFNLVGPAFAAAPPPAARVSDCNIRAAAPDLRRLGTAEVLAPLDIGPDLLYYSPLKVFATGHHRGNLAMRETISLFLGPDEAAHRALLARGTGYVMLCTDVGEPSLYVHDAPSGFAAHLVKGEVPAWLTPVATGGGRTFRVFRVAG